MLLRSGQFCVKTDFYFFTLKFKIVTPFKDLNESTSTF